jgi:hypothetical protein
LEQSCYPEFQAELLQIFLRPWYQDAAAAGGTKQSPTKELYAELLSMLNDHATDYPTAFAAYKLCVLTRARHRNRRHAIIQTLGLDRKPQERDDILKGINWISAPQAGYLYRRLDIPTAGWILLSGVFLA